MNCPKCGNTVPFGAKFCDDCGCAIGQEPAVTATVQEAANTAAVQMPEAEIPAQKPENVVTGTVGALLGAAIGGAAIILLSRMGYVASISGLILAVCTLKGYELLGGRLSTKGIVISIVLMLAMPYLADRIDWALLVMDEWSSEGVTFAEAYAAIPLLIEEEAIELSDYLLNLVMIYAFVLLGAFSSIWSVIKKK